MIDISTGIETNFVAGVGAIKRLLQLRLLLSQYGVYGCKGN
jgi:hypothetical protein